MRVETGTTNDVTPPQSAYLLLCLSLLPLPLRRIGSAAVVVMMLTSSVHCPPGLSRSDQKISALMTRTNAEISLTRSPAPRLFASFGFGRMNSMRGREARFIPYLPSKSSLVRGSDLLLNGYVADGLCHDTTRLPRHSVDPSASEFLGANGFLTWTAISPKW